MITITAEEAKLQFESLVAAVLEDREEVVIRYQGRDAVLLVPTRQTPADYFKEHPELSEVTISGDITTSLDRESWTDPSEGWLDQDDDDSVSITGETVRKENARRKIKEDE